MKDVGNFFVTRTEGKEEKGEKEEESEGKRE